MTRPSGGLESYYNDKTLKAATHSIDEQGDNFKILSGDMGGVAKKLAGHSLSQNAFSTTDLLATSAAADLSAAYNHIFEHLRTLLSGATEEFMYFSGALHRVADEYRYSDENTAWNIEQIYGEGGVAPE